MKATYNERTRTFKVIWDDAVKAFRGEKYPHGRKQEKWKGDKAPTKKEQNAILSRLLMEATEEEEKARLELERIKAALTANPCEQLNNAINAAHYLQGLKGADICKSQTEDKKAEKRTKAFIQKFADFLFTNYPNLPLHEVKKQVIQEFFSSISHLASQTRVQYFVTLNKVFKKVMNDFDESEIKYVNHFEKYGKTEYIAISNDGYSKSAFRIDQLKELLKFAAIEKIEENRNNKNRKYIDSARQKFVILYFAMVTGWRISDITYLKHDQINMTEKTITMTHGKTRTKTGHKTVIYITPLMQRILEAQIAMSKNYNNLDNEHVFNVRESTNKVSKKYSSTIARRLIDQFCDKNELNKVKKNKVTKTEYKEFSCHSLRKSVITELGLCEKFTQERINYFVGHSSGTVQAKSYLKFAMYPERTTRAMIEHMEQLLDMEFYFTAAFESELDAWIAQLAAETWLDETEISQMKIDFWQDEAIDRLYAEHKNKLLMYVIRNIINKCNEYRKQSGERYVTVETVEHILQEDGLIKK